MKWVFPDVQIEPEETLIVMTSGKNRAPADGGELHTNFKLNPNGGYLGLCDDSTPPNIVSVIEGGYPAFTESSSYSYFNIDEINVNAALESLNNIGGMAKEAVPMLLDISRESNLDARMTLASVLVEIAPENPEVVATVAALVVEAEEAGKDQYTTVRLVESLKPQGKDSIGKIEPFLKSGEMKMRLAAFNALGSAGPASEVVPILLKNVTDGNVAIRKAAMSAIGKLGAGASEAEPALILASQSQVMSEALCAMEALLGIESRSPETLTTLIALLNRYWDESEKLDPNQKNVSEEELLGDQYSIGVFLSGLKPFGLQAKEAIPILIKYMGDEIVDQKTIEDAFSGMGDAGVSALAEVVKNEDEDLFAKCRAVQILFLLGQEHNSAISSLTEALKSSDRNVRANAITGLGKLGAKADSAVAALNEALNDADWGNRQRAAVALHNIRPNEFAQPFRVKPWEDFLTMKSKNKSRMLNRIPLGGIIID
jgi:HEAT repeat protein